MADQNVKIFFDQLSAKASKIESVSIAKKELAYNCGTYHLLRIATEIKPKQPIVLIRAGIHGDEISGPLSILKYFEQIIEYSRQKSVALIIYPLANPSGFERGTRYNCDNDKGEFGNNDVIRYKTSSGSFIDDLGKEEKTFVSWEWSDNVPNSRLAQESKIFLSILRQEPLSQIVGCLDLHQDYLTSKELVAAYHYSFGDLATYNRIITEINKIAPIWTNKPIGAGFNTQVNEKGEVVKSGAGEEDMATDNNGFIVRHDGSLPDLFYRLGAPFCVTTETTGAMPLAKAMLINKIWIFGIIDLISEYKFSRDR